MKYQKLSLSQKSQVLDELQTMIDAGVLRPVSEEAPTNRKDSLKERIQSTLEKYQR